MPNALQLWLSPRPARKVSRDQVPFICAEGGAAMTFSTRKDGVEVTSITHDMSRPACHGGKNCVAVAIPHAHLSHPETHQVRSGSYGFSVAGEEDRIMRAGDPPVTFAAGQAHGWWPIEEDGVSECKIATWEEPATPTAVVVGEGEAVEGEGEEEVFYRNSQSYLNDVHEAGMQPSPFQMLVFVRTQNSVQHVPGMPMSVVKAIHRFGAFIGRRVLGYSAVYPEYTPTRKSF